MKLRREHNADFGFTSLETFDLSFSNGVLFSGQSANDILHIWILPAIHINAVTCNATRLLTAPHDYDHDDVAVVGSSDRNINRSKRPVDRQICMKQTNDCHIRTNCYTGQPFDIHVLVTHQVRCYASIFILSRISTLHTA